MLINFEHKFAYLSVPKCACSSLKNMLFAVENGFEFQNFSINGKQSYIHNLVPSVEFRKLPFKKIDGFKKFAVVREPVSRLVSCYRSKVLTGMAFRTINQQEGLAKSGLPALPEFDQFVENLGQYQEVSGVIRGHSRQLEYYLGKDPGWFDELFDISEVEEFTQRVGAIVGKELSTPHRNSSARHGEDTIVSDQARKTINDQFASDTEIFGAWFK